MSTWVFLVIYLAVILISKESTFVDGLPIRGPDLDSCRPVASLGPIPKPIDCCFVDKTKPVKDFKFNLDLPMRVRRPAHKLNEEAVRKYERAVELLRAPPPEDPRSYDLQQKLHCAYYGAYAQFNSKEAIEVHRSWLFYRWYVYFHERILASLIGDNTFAIPCWAWDMQNEHDPPANTIPRIFANENSSLYNDKRSKFHQYPYKASLVMDFYVYNKDLNVLLLENYDALWQSMIGHVRTPEAFYGGKLSEGDRGSNLHGGIFLYSPHGAVHGWTGDIKNFYGEDMGPGYSAARDPIFLAHHTQVENEIFH